MLFHGQSGVQRRGERAVMARRVAVGDSEGTRWHTAKKHNDVLVGGVL